MAGKRVIIVGHDGQDGQLLTRALREEGDDVLGIGRTSNSSTVLVDDMESIRVERPDEVERAVRTLRPHEVYYLAAYHASSEDRDTCDIREGFTRSVRVHVEGPLHFLEAIRRHSPSTRLFYASSSLVFGPRGSVTPQDENTPPAPAGSYALTKALGGEAVREYRERHGIFGSVGILYNHESTRRPRSFVSRKISLAALAILAGEQETLTLGDLDAVVDWGYAPDFVDAFRRILALDEPDDFVVATGRGHTVRDFVSVAFEHVGLDWQRHVEESSALLGREAGGRVGDPRKLRRRSGWEATLSFEEMVRRLLDETAVELGVPLADKLRS